MSIASEITRLQGAKADLKTAIEAKGVNVPSATLIDGYATLVGQIPTGGGGGNEHTGHVDTEGLQALGWDAQDIQWLQDHVWWDAEVDEEWAVNNTEKSYGPNGATPLTWETRADIKNNVNVRYLPKLAPPSNITNFGFAFNGYPYLRAIPTHGWDLTNVTTFSNAFLNNFNLISIGDVSSWVTSSCTQIPAFFQNCYCIQDLGDLSGWDVSNVTSVGKAFYGCYLLRSIGDLSGWDTGKMTSMNEMFYACNHLASVGDLSGWDTSKVTTFESMFGNCYELHGIGDLSEWDTSSLTTARQMFYNCYSLGSLNLTDWDMGDVTNLQSMINGCYSLSSLLGVGSWDTSKVTNVSTLFNQMFYLDVIDLYSWDLSLCANVGSAATSSIFYNLYNVRTIKLGPKFFNFQSTTLYANNCRAWTRNSVYESLYTNQTLRDSSSPAKTVNLYSLVYDSLSAQDIADIATKNITLVRV